MNGATGRGRFADALARLGEPEGERGLVPSWEGRVFTRNGQLKATASDAEVLTMLSGMTYGRGPVGMPLGELAGLRKGIAACACRAGRCRGRWSSSTGCSGRRIPSLTRIVSRPDVRATDG